MTKKTKFAAISIWILLTRAYDAFCTYQYTPDLSHEANPLVSILGFGWTPLLLTLVFLSIYIIYAYYQATFKSYDLLPEESNLSFSDFVGYVYTGEKQSWTVLFYKLPNSMARFNHVMGNLMTQNLVFAGLVSTIMWLLLNYSNFYNKIHSAELIYGILLIGSILIAVAWYSKLYKKYQAIETEQLPI